MTLFNRNRVSQQNRNWRALLGAYRVWSRSLSMSWELNALADAAQSTSRRVVIVKFRVASALSRILSKESRSFSCVTNLTDR